MSTDTYAADPVAAFLASGGRITKCPPAYVVETPNATKRFDHTGVQKWDDLPAKERRNIRQEKAKERQELEKVKKERQRRTAEEMRAHLKRTNDIRQANLAARRAHIRRKYEDGASIDELSQELKIGPKQVRALLKKAGAEMRKGTAARAIPVQSRPRRVRGEAKPWKVRGGQRPFTQEELDMAHKAREGWSNKQLAEHFGRPRTSIGGVLLRMKKAGIDIGLGGSKNLTDAQLAEMKRLAEQGVSAKVIAETMGLHRSTVRGRLSTMGLYAPASSFERALSQGVDLERDRKIYALLDQGLSRAKVAERIGCSVGGVSAALRRRVMLPEAAE